MVLEWGRVNILTAVHERTQAQRKFTVMGRKEIDGIENALPTGNVLFLNVSHLCHWAGYIPECPNVLYPAGDSTEDLEGLGSNGPQQPASRRCLPRAVSPPRAMPKPAADC